MNILLDRLAFFDAVERRFARQARITTLLAGLSGLYMVIRLDLWDRFLFARFWWMHAMVIVWLLFTLMLFVVEPLFLHNRLHSRPIAEPESTFRTASLLHWLLLTLSLITVLGAVAGSHGLFFLE
jgi:membrane protein YdbS with pleckstrin-like domain